MLLAKLAATDTRCDTLAVLVLAGPPNGLVQERWARASQRGLRRESDAYPVGTSDADLAIRRERLDDVFREERDLLAPISAELANGPRVAIVADPEGVIVSARAGHHFIDPIARVRLVEVARWGEETRGTNAIGTAIAEGCAVGVIGDAHFEERNRHIFCYATPIHDAYGHIVAVLDVSGPILSHDPTVGLAVETAGLLLDRALRSMAYSERRSGALAAIERLLHRSSEPMMLVEANGVVRVVNRAARGVLGMPSDRGLTCEHVFGMGFGEFVASAAGCKGLHFETRAGVFRIDIDPVAGSLGRTLAAIVHFETSHATATTRVAAESPAFSAILSQDPAVQKAKALAARLATTTLPVLLLAETGTGKELFARAIHAESDRGSRPFIAINCGALSPSLIASELFGYAPGAFTGAARHGSEGHIAAAHGGTLFLDEIAEMPDSLQASLLRVLDDGVYERVGETRERRAEFRLICATCRDLPAMVADGRFRSDLYYRIRGACITIPAMRDRTDAVWLATRLLERIAPPPSPRLSADAEAWIAAYDWPGNVRELKSAMEYGLALSAGASAIAREHLPSQTTPSVAREPGAESKTRDHIVRQAVESALRSCDGNVTGAARSLGVSRGTVYRALRDRKGH